jgi:hypothetical protein
MINAMSYTRDLEQGGLSKDQSNAIIKVLLEIMNQKFSTRSDIQLSELAIRSDMKEMENSIRSDMKEMENSIRSDMKEMENSIRSDMQEMENSIRSDMQEMENSIRSDMQEMGRTLKESILKEVTIIIDQRIHAAEDRITIRLTKVMVILATLMTGILGMIQKIF